MTHKFNIPEAVLGQHLAVLGKTGSGKTSTAKLAIEQVVSGGSRVCILDPIKSDWWGLTSSADGKRPGLPFHILGGPRGHVSLHSAAGKAIAEIVAAGGLPLSIIDMADFEPGGQNRFFADFAPTLLRKMRGVLYLVLEEAHLFAPKEKSGLGHENMSTHWAKTLAQAGRSKGIRLLVLTQRTQALHNALLGSCDSIIAHRLTAPADQEPVVKWLKANCDKETSQKVADSLSSLKNGEGWLCSGEAQIFDRRQFPRIATYDNTRTPTADSGEHVVKTAAVDAEQLRSIIGEAVKEAEANDPKLLRKEIERLRTELARGVKAAAPAVDQAAIDRAVRRAIGEERQQHVREINERDRVIELLKGRMGKAERAISDSLGLLHVNGEATPKPIKSAAPKPVPQKQLAAQPVKAVANYTQNHTQPSGDSSGLGKCERAILAVLSQYPEGCESGKLTLLAGYRFSGGFRNALSTLRSAGLIEGENSGTMTITPAGEACGPFPALPSGAGLIDYWLNHNSLGKCEREILSALLDNPDGLDSGELCAATGYEFSGGFRNALSVLRTAGLIVGKNSETMKACNELLQANQEV